jgi:hypothetical protein
MPERQITDHSVPILLEQYKIAEERRSEFGRQFMQTTGFAVGIFAAVIGLTRPDIAVLRVICAVGGPFFLGISILANRLGERQDDCEQTLEEIEVALRTAGHHVVSLRPSRKRFGARKILVLFMATVGLVLILFAVFGNQILPAGPP